MNKEAILRSVENAIKEGVLTLSDLRAFISAHETVTGSDKPAKSINLSRILYYIGAGIAFLGIAIFIGQKWDELTSVARIVVTLGAGLAFFLSAVLIETSKKLDQVSTGLHFLAALLIPGGVFVTLDELGFHGSNWGPGIIFASFVFLYLLAYRFYRQNVLMLFTIVYGVLAFLLITDAMGGKFPPFDRGDYISYRIAGLSAVFIGLGYTFRNTGREVLVPWLYGLGSLGFLGATFALQGWDPSQSYFWETVYPALVFGAMFLSLPLRSRAMLFLGAAFLIGDIFKLTDEYFKDSLSWPLLLIFAGFLLIGVGYLTFYLNRKFSEKGTI